MAERIPLYWKEAIAILLAVAGMMVDHTPGVFACLLGAVILGCWGVVTHHQSLRRMYRVLLCIAIVEIGFGLFLYLRYASIEKELQQLRGTLVSGSETAPISRCPSNEMVVYLGEMRIGVPGNVYEVISTGDRPILVVRKNFLFGFISALSIQQLQLFDETGRDEVVNISGDKYFVSPLLRFERTGLNNLTVFDRHGDEILYVEYTNEKAVRIRGVFRYEDHIIRVTNDEIINAVGGRIKPGTGCWHIGRGITF